MGQTLNKEEIKKIIEEELRELTNYDSDIRNIEIDIDGEDVKATVTFGIHIVDEDNYIGLNSY